MLTPEKWFARSRGLWGAALPFIVAVVAALGVDTTDLAGELDRIGVAVINLVGSVLALLSRFRPDGAALRATPKLPPGGPGPLSFALVLLGVVALACASTPAERYVQASQAWLAANRTYNAVLAADNAALEACFTSEEPDDCEPDVPFDHRQRARVVVERGHALLDELEDLLGEEDAAARREAIVRELEELAIRLAVLTPED